MGITFFQIQSPLPFELVQLIVSFVERFPLSSYQGLASNSSFNDSNDTNQSKVQSIQFQYSTEKLKQPLLALDKDSKFVSEASSLNKIVHSFSSTISWSWVWNPFVRSPSSQSLKLNERVLKYTEGWCLNEKDMSGAVIELIQICHSCPLLTNELFLQVLKIIFIII